MVSQKQQKIEALIKALGIKVDFDVDAEVEFIKIQAEAAARNYTYKWVV